MSSYSINITDAGNGNFTAALLRSPTAATGGTSINSTVGGAMDMTKTFKNGPGEAVILALQLLLDDRAAGN
jgi:hypothetical protein